MSPAEKGKQLNVECSTNVVYGETSGFQLTKRKPFNHKTSYVDFAHIKV